MNSFIRIVATLFLWPVFATGWIHVCEFFAIDHTLAMYCVVLVSCISSSIAGSVAVGSFGEK